MAENKDTKQVENANEERRDPEHNDRRESEHVTVQKLFNDYGFEEERKGDSRRHPEEN